MYLAHFFGDLHQPLHGAGEFDDSGAGDQGGNLKLVPRRGKLISLHWLWDDAVADDSDPAALADELGRGTETDAASASCGPEMVERAALESHEIADQRIYPLFHYDATLTDTEGYRLVMRPIARERMRSASVRLACELEWVLGVRPTQ
jgi:hypothetical protein